MNIFVNFYNSKTGGGKNILDNFVYEILNDSKSNYNWIILVPDANNFIKNDKNIRFITINSIARYNFFFPLLYFFSVPRIIKEYDVDLVVNFGDIVIPTKIKQIYFFDWAYAVYDEPYVWTAMKTKDLIVRKTKVYLIDCFIYNANLIICQTKNIAERLNKKYALKNILVIPTPVGLDFSLVNTVGFDFPQEKKIFLYPASFATHKNFDIIISLGKLITKKMLPMVIVITVDETIASTFLQQLKDERIDCILNVGKVNSTVIPELYKKCDAMLFPSLLESYGLPYIEAMAFEKPILTSDLDFAHAICDDVAFYFDPFDTDSILNVMKHYDDDKVQLEEKIRKGKVTVETLPDWKKVFLEFEEQIEIILNKDSHES